MDSFSKNNFQSDDPPVFNDLPNTFCAYPWLQICGTPLTPLAVCGEAREMTHRSQLEGFFTSARVRDLRRSLAEGKKPEHCTSCWVQEDEGRFSTRMHGLYLYERSIGKDKLLQILNESAKNNYSVSKPQRIDIKLSSNCNLACRMCSPSNTAKLWKEYDENREDFKNFRFFYEFAREYYDDPKEYYSVDEWMAVSDDIVSLNISGGEPCIMKGVQDYLEAFLKKGYAQRVELCFNTNGTKPNWQLFEIIKNFKQTNLSISIDGTGSIYEYIRYPAKWEETKKSVLQIRDFFNKSPSVKLCISPTYQILNVLQLTDIYSWCDTEGLDWIIDSFVTEPYYQSAMLLPASIRALAADRLDAYVQKKSNLTWAQDYGIPRATAHLRNDKKFSESDFSLFIEQTALMDRIRKQKFSQSCPELFELLQKSGIDLGPLSH